MPKLSRMIRRLAVEPPFRLFAKFILTLLPVSVRTREAWDLSPRPAYLAGVLFAADQAKREGIEEISVAEFGVASGKGLLALQYEAELVERETGVRIRVFGFDAGPTGLPEFCGDYRDLPDFWRPGDYPMDVPWLRSQLTPRTTLVLGNVDDTVPGFYAEYDPPPFGFISIDLDLYSSTVAALRLLSDPERRMLLHLAMYFDDIDLMSYHRFAGELLAINEFNDQCDDVKIDEWRGLPPARPMPQAPWLKRMFMAHDLQAISRVVLQRDPRKI
jgi:hypothetical protein